MHHRPGRDGGRALAAARASEKLANCPQPTKYVRKIAPREMSMFRVFTRRVPYTCIKQAKFASRPMNGEQSARENSSRPPAGMLSAVQFHSLAPFVGVFLCEYITPLGIHSVA